jgi:hypothetical protein
MIENYFFEYIYPEEYIMKNEIKRLYIKIYIDNILYYASKYNNKKLIDKCIKKEADINYSLWSAFYKCINKNKANIYYGLQGACEGGHLDLVKFYLEKVAKINILHIGYAYKSGNKEIINLLEQLYKHNYEWALNGACLGGHIDLIKLCIEKGARNFNSCFYCLYIKGHIELVKIFMNKINLYEYFGKNLKIFKLLENKLGLNRELYWSINYNNYNISKYLIKKKGITSENRNYYKKYMKKLDKYNKLQKIKYLY